MRKGSHHTQTVKDVIGKSCKGRTVWNKGLTKYIDARIKSSSGSFAKGVISAFKGKRHTSESNRRNSEAHKDREPWNKGLTCVQTAWNKGLTKETDSRVSNTSKKLSEGASWNKGLTKETDNRLVKVSETMKEFWESKEYRQKRSNDEKARWKDPEYAKKILHRRILSGPEQEFICISDRFYFAFDFVGDGTLVIDGKNPDFVSLKDDRKLIEIWGEYFKKGRNPKDLIDFYKVRGYECLVIYASELKHLEKIINRVREFVEN